MIKRIIKRFSKSVLVNFISYLINVFSYLPIQNKKLALFGTTDGSFRENSKYLYLYLLKNSDFKVYWIGNKKIVKTLKSKSLPTAYIWSIKAIFLHMRTKFYFISHSLKTVCPYKPSNKTIVINQWHGTPIKKIGFDRKDKKDLVFNNKKQYITTWGKPNYYIVGSENLIDLFEKAMGVTSKQILAFGNPKNDFLLKNKSNISLKKELINKINININAKTKVILYAPTHRDSEDGKKLLIKELFNLTHYFSEVMGKECFTLLIKLHPKDAKKIGNLKELKLLINEKNNIFDVSNFQDIQEILYLTNYLITDYSSIIFDYSILSRPTYLFNFDEKEYKKNRGDFYKIKYIDSFKKFKSSKKIFIDILKNKNYLKNKNIEFKNFFNQKIPNASKRILEFMKELNR